MSDGLKIFTGERYGSSCLNGRVYCTATTTMVAEIGTKLLSQDTKQANNLKFLQGEQYVS
jgi:hypothetical protein